MLFGFENLNARYLEEEIGECWRYVSDANVPGKKQNRSLNSFEHSGQHRTSKRVVNVDDAWGQRQIVFSRVHVMDLNVMATMGGANSFEIRLACFAKLSCEIDTDHRLEGITRGAGQHASLAATEVHETVLAEIQIELIEDRTDVLRLAGQARTPVRQMFRAGQFQGR